MSDKPLRVTVRPQKAGTTVIEVPPEQPSQTEQPKPEESKNAGKK